MNFYGPKNEEQHKFSGRLIPLLEASYRAIATAANQPSPERRYAAVLPKWCDRILEELTKTVFKNVVDVAMQGPFDACKSGRGFGVLLRFGVFVWKELPVQLKREGLLDLSPSRKRKLREETGFEYLFRVASEISGKPIRKKRDLIKAGEAQFDEITGRVMGATNTIIEHLLNRPAEEQHEFLCGIAEGFAGVMDSDGEPIGKRRRYPIYLSLLLYWPEIMEMQQAQPPKTRRDLLEWLEKQEGKQMVEDQKQFNEICEKIDLDLAAPGHPRRQKGP